MRCLGLWHTRRIIIRNVVASFAGSVAHTPQPHFLLLHCGFSYKWRKTLGMLLQLINLCELIGVPLYTQQQQQHACSLIGVPLYTQQQQQQQQQQHACSLIVRVHVPTVLHVNVAFDRSIKSCFSSHAHALTLHTCTRAHVHTRTHAHTHTQMNAHTRIWASRSLSRGLSRVIGGKPAVCRSPHEAEVVC